MVVLILLGKLTFHPKGWRLTSLVLEPKEFWWDLQALLKFTKSCLSLLMDRTVLCRRESVHVIHLGSVHKGCLRGNLCRRKMEFTAGRTASVICLGQRNSRRGESKREPLSSKACKCSREKLSAFTISEIKSPKALSYAWVSLLPTPLVQFNTIAGRKLKLSQVQRLYWHSNYCRHSNYWNKLLSMTKSNKQTFKIILVTRRPVMGLPGF